MPTITSQILTSSGITLTDSADVKLLTYRSGKVYYQQMYYDVADFDDAGIVCRYAYETLETNEERCAYNAYLDVVTQHKTYVDTGPYALTSGRWQYIAHCVGSDNPQLFWYEGYCDVRIGQVYPQYHLSAAEVEQYEEELTQKVAKIVGDCRNAPNTYWHLRDAALCIMSTTYSNTGDRFERTSVGTLINNSSLCAARTQTLA